MYKDQQSPQLKHMTSTGMVKATLGNTCNPPTKQTAKLPWPGETLFIQKWQRVLWALRKSCLAPQGDLLQANCHRVPGTVKQQRHWRHNFWFLKLQAYQGQTGCQQWWWGRGDSVAIMGEFQAHMWWACCEKDLAVSKPT